MERRERAHLVLSAGGVRCLSYIGALERLETKYEFTTVATCSAGTLVGALYCAGLSPGQMRETVATLELRELAGHARLRPLRRLWTLREWPYALYREPGMVEKFRDILRAHELPEDPALGDLQRPMATAAVDVAANRLLVYSSDVNPTMAVTQVLRIATAIPLVYPPHPPEDGEGREVMDAALASHTPVWLATGQSADLPIVVLRAPVRGAPPRSNVLTWVNDALYSGIAARDTFQLERSPNVVVCDIETEVPAFDFDLDENGIEDLMEAGTRAADALLERAQEESPPPPPPRRPDGDDEAELNATNLYRKSLDRLARTRTPTVFLSYAREDRSWVGLLRDQLASLIADEHATVWDDSYIRAGAPWDAAIHDAILRARVAVLFVSKSFLDSDYIESNELPLLFQQREERGLQILWVPVDRTPPPARVSDIEAIGDPSEPLTKSDATAQSTLATLGIEIEKAFRAYPQTPASM